MLFFVLSCYFASSVDAAVTRLRKWTGSSADNCTKSTEIQILYFSNDCLGVTGDYESSLIRGCNDHSSNLSGYNISSVNCVWNSSLSNNDKCSIDCSYGYKDYGACDIVDNADYGDLYINEEYDCVTEWPNDDIDDYYAYWELYSDSECTNPIYREVVPNENNYQYKCVKNRAFEWRYLYFCDSTNGELTMINDFNISSTCGDISQVDLNSKWKFSVNSTCQEASYLSTWGAPSQYYKGYCKQQQPSTTTDATGGTATGNTGEAAETTGMVQTTVLNGNDTAGTGNGPSNKNSGGNDVVGPAIGITAGILILFCLFGICYANFRKRERNTLIKPLAAQDEL